MAQNPDVLNFYKLLDKHFIVPSYQRGYRWEEKHIEDLLDDLYEFGLKAYPQNSKNTTLKDGVFYCLQPICVRKNKDGSYDLIDGQQRLTTLFLILSRLESRRIDMAEGEKPDLYDITFETRSDEDDYLLKRQFMNDNESYRNNIDFFYIRKAYEAIDMWFQSHKNAAEKIIKLLDPPHDAFNDEEEEKEFNSSIHDVRVLWYLAEEDESDDGARNSSIDIFSRLNHGKIELTPTELIKALFLQCDGYPDNDRVRMKEWTIKVASEWDSIEKELQDPFFWNMITRKGYAPASHISLILSYLSDELYNYDSNKNIHGNPNGEYQPEAIRKIDERDKSEKDSRFDYLVIDKYLNDRKNSISTYEQRVKWLWTRVIDIFTVFKNWYSDRTMYHLVGLTVYLYELKSSKDPEAVNKIVKKLYNASISGSKTCFKNTLRTEIGNLIMISSSKKIDGEKPIPYTLETINYNETPKDIIRILVAFNVYKQIQSEKENSRFAFQLMKDQKITSLEHIHPQNLNVDEIDLDELVSWVNRKSQIVNGKFLHWKNEKDKQKVKDAIDKIKNLLKGYPTNDISQDKAIKEDFGKNKQQYHDQVEIIDNMFDEMANMKPEIMHSIKNMALVDKDTNSALSNHLLDEKRQILKQREKGDKDKEGIYVPIATKDVFDKAYSSEIDDMQFWTKVDREDYYSEIETAYNYFVNSSLK